MVGGVLGSNNQEQTMECYDHMTESWSSLAPPRQKRYNHCAVSLDEYIYVIGGNKLRKHCDRSNLDFSEGIAFVVPYRKFNKQNNK